MRITAAVAILLAISLKSPGAIANNISHDNSCHQECSQEGCRGPGPSNCSSCAHDDFDGTCVNSCKDQERVYQVSSNQCKSCHEECASCTGPDLADCTTCRNVKEGSVCVARCSVGTFESNGICEKCHQSCRNGCTGPSDKPRFGGCNDCQKKLFDPFSGIVRCMTLEEECPKDYYYDDFGGCRHCSNSLRFFLDDDEKCTPCHEACDGCSGPGPRNCLSCNSQYVKLLDDETKLSKKSLHTCVHGCPDNTHQVYHRKVGDYCSSKPQNL